MRFDRQSTILVHKLQNQDLIAIQDTRGDIKSALLRDDKTNLAKSGGG